MKWLFPKFNDKFILLKYNILIGYCAFQILVFILLFSFSFFIAVPHNILKVTLITNLVFPIIIIFLSRVNLNIASRLNVGISYFLTLIFLFGISSSGNSVQLMSIVVMFVVALFATLVINWQLGLIISILNMVFLFLDIYLEKQNLLNSIQSNVLPPILFVILLSPLMFIIIGMAISYTITLKSIYLDYKSEERKKNEIADELIGKNSALYDLNVELKENMSQMETFNSQMERAIEQAYESDRLKSAFLLNISHEIRTPLNSIIGFLSLMEERCTNSHCEQEEYIGYTINSGYQLLNIITDIIDLSQLDTGQILIYETEFDLNDLLEVIKSNYSEIALRKGLNFKLKHNLVKGKSYIYSDYSKISQVINNLLSNAVKFTDKGCVELMAELSETKLIICVTDTGMGIEPKKIEIIFEKFHQAETELTKNFGGLGIGLTIVREMVKKLKGTVEVNSEFGKGSTFKIEVPIKRMKHQLFSDLKLAPQIRTAITYILVAEDDANNYLYIEILLRKYKNLKLIHAWNGQEALDYIKTNPEISIVLMDIKMPVMDGVEAFKEIRKIRNEIPILAVTAYALNHEKEKFESYGFNGYLTKPVKKEELLEVLHL